MEFDIKKYDNTTFSDDDLTHKRIKVLLLWFEYEVHKNDLPPEAQIKLMTKWIDKIESQEYYEVIPFFQQKKNEMIDSYNNPPKEVMVEKTVTTKDIMLQKTVKVTPIDVTEPLLIRVKEKIKKWYRLKFKWK